VLFQLGFFSYSYSYS